MTSITIRTEGPTIVAPPHSVPVPVPRRVEGVDVIFWPAEDDRRRLLAEGGQPCLLVLDPDEPPPRVTELEDWARGPVGRADLTARCAALRARTTCGEPPTLDEGLLFHRGAWAAIPPGQVDMVALLVENLGAVVHKDQLSDAARASGASHHDDAVKSAVTRLGQRIAVLGLAIRSIRGRGYLLEVEGACPVHGTRSGPNTKDLCP